MSPKINSLYRLKKKDITPAGKVLSQAFFDNPMFKFLFPDLNKRKKKLKYIFEFMVHYGVFHGEVYANSKNLEGIAVWIPPEKVHQTTWSMIKCGIFRVIRKIGFNAAKRSIGLSNYIESIHMRLISFDHWYLSPIGVSPDLQGNGYGSILLRAMFDKINKQNLPIYLETDTEKNVKIYTHYGFKLLEEIKYPYANFKNWFMLKEN
jgi:ribosomal protein S18 acetylase RimI-like enzyme